MLYRPNEVLAILVLEASQTSIENVSVMTDVFTKYSVAVPTQDQLCGSYMAERSQIMWPVMVSSSGSTAHSKISCLSSQFLG